jgi:DNA replication protein DnaC
MQTIAEIVMSMERECEGLSSVKGFFENILDMLKNPEKYEMAEEEKQAELQKQVDSFNASTGMLEGYDCTACKNRGYSQYLKDSLVINTPCSCLEIRKSLKIIERSGLKDLLEDYTFDNYICEHGWQKEIKAAAERFTTSDTKGKWFYIGGQVGSGKTHLCTAIVSEFLKQGKPAKYMLWRDEIVTIKAAVNDEQGYANLINPLKEVEVLYIDDFFKTQSGSMPTVADANVAFEILNYRYNSKSLITIISGERYIGDLQDIDDAVASRIFHKTDGNEFCKDVGKDPNRNYRWQTGKNNK